MKIVAGAATLFGFKILFYCLLFFLYYTVFSFNPIWAALSGLILWFGGKQLWKETQELFRSSASDRKDS